MKNLKLSTILFDMDGVLIDSMPYHSETWVKSFSEHGLNFSPTEAYLNEGSTGSFTINKVYQHQKGRKATEEEIQSIYHLKTKLISTKSKPEAIKDMPSFVSLVQNLGLDRWVVTGSAQKKLIGRLERYYPDCFDSQKMVTGNDVKIGKPHPEPYLKALEQSGYKAEEAVVIENAPLGVQSAKAAGIYTIAINTGILENSILTDAGADVVFNSVDELTQWWKENYSEKDS